MAKFPFPTAIKSCINLQHCFYTAVMVAICFSTLPVLAALNCTTQPSCNELGYTTTLPSECADRNILYCPFDRSYKKCIFPSCGSLGYTQTDKSAWCGNIIKCPNDESYTSCVALTAPKCPSGYFNTYTNVMSCGTTGAQGWTLSTQNVTTADGQSITCGKCSAKTCPSGSSLGSKFCSSGYHLTTIGYSGNASCTKCEKTCADGYAQSPAGCGNSQGWTLGMVDSKGCGKCIAKTCDSSFSNIDCDNTVNGYRCVTCYSGNNKKGKIVSCSSLGYRCDCQTYCSNSNDSSLNSGNSNLTNPGNSSGSLQTGVIKPVQCMCYAGT